ncbi:(2Fe-2S)-binding protein [Lysinibacillus sphaericus]|uniref:putative iron-sulfur cluster-binding metallochaperone n=1 Tax=Lysinibacillus sphaericus TaxID=1421 RepID=UPI0018CF968B|nr:(2Fe-2S)-binding protein [Lysinibacillus sphaericus]MBG9456192.1 (2Fe-2S)-binding protein [Lysinibacillus sphaericus]MBG9479188.1 (2Fe-2S)-binding protein [Lysinibacillus sphaericus]MBG9591514.1 (2Fe-2S)-binding protein [Lysinibacillus sphaericus]
MGKCCSSPKNNINENTIVCPSCKINAKNIKLITIKSMMKPSALESINAMENHYFCSTKDCDVVYFDTSNKEYTISDIKVTVHQKDDTLSTPVCYCFDWTKDKIKQYVENELTPNPLEHIRTNIKKNRCGCEVNNPQGSCCLGNVTKYMKGLA